MAENDPNPFGWATEKMMDERRETTNAMRCAAYCAQANRDVARLQAQLASLRDAVEAEVEELRRLGRANEKISADRLQALLDQSNRGEG